MKKKAPGVSFPPKEARPFGLLMSDDDCREQSVKWAEEDHSKLLLLCRQYGIQEGPYMFYELALALARELYPDPKKRGRKSKWTILNRGALVVEIERLTKNDDPGHGIAWAAKQLAKREPWKSFLEIKEANTTNPDSAEALRKAYYDFKNDKRAGITRKAFKWHEYNDTIAEWEREVDDYVRNPNLK